LAARIDDVVHSGNQERMAAMMKKIKTMRQSGLEKQGEFGADNLAFKLLRNNGYIKRLVDARNAARDVELSLAELAKPKKYVKYGFKDESVEEASLADMRNAFQHDLTPLVDPDTKKVYRSRDEYIQAEKLKAKQKEIAATLVHTKPKPWSGGVYESPDGVNPTTKMFLEQPEDENEITVRQFIDFVVERKKTIWSRFIASLEMIFLHSRFFAVVDRFFPKYNISKRVNLMKIRGISEIDIKNFAINFHQNTINKKTIQPLLDELKRFVNNGDYVIIASGGYDVYLNLFAADYKVKYIVSSKIKFNNGKI
jgi:phosphoserine phosphatase